MQRLCGGMHNNRSPRIGYGRLKVSDRPHVQPHHKRCTPPIGLRCCLPRQHSVNSRHLDACMHPCSASGNATQHLHALLCHNSPCIPPWSMYMCLVTCLAPCCCSTHHTLCALPCHVSSHSWRPAMRSPSTHQCCPHERFHISSWYTNAIISELDHCLRLCWCGKAPCARTGCAACPAVTGTSAPHPAAALPGSLQAAAQLQACRAAVQHPAPARQL